MIKETEILKRNLEVRQGKFRQLRTLTRAVQQFWWPGVGQDLKQEDATDRPVQACRRPGEKLYADLVGPMPVTGTGQYKCVLTKAMGEDQFSGTQGPNCAWGTSSVGKGEATKTLSGGRT